MQISKTLTNAVSWRQPGIYYRTNEFFLDVYECLNMTLGKNGEVIKSEVIGKIKVNPLFLMEG